MPWIGFEPAQDVFNIADVLRLIRFDANDHLNPVLIAQIQNLAPPLLCYYPHNSRAIFRSNFGHFFS